MICRFGIAVMTLRQRSRDKGQCKKSQTMQYCNPQARVHVIWMLKVQSYGKRVTFVGLLGAERKLYKG